MNHADDQLRALRTGSIGPLGRIEQVGLFAHGLKTNTLGRRRGALILAARLGLVALVIAVGVLVAG